MKFFPQRLASKIILSICLLVIILVGAGFFYSNALYHFKTVVPNVLYRSGQLSPLGLRLVYARTHFKTDVMLRSKKAILENQNDWFSQEQAFCKLHHIKLIVLYMPPDHTPTTDQLNKFIQTVNSNKAKPILVHCNQGIIRTGMMVAAYRIIVLHQTKNHVIKHIPLWGHRLKNHPEVITFIQQLDKKTP